MFTNSIDFCTTYVVYCGNKNASTCYCSHIFIPTWWFLLPPLVCRPQIISLQDDCVLCLWSSIVSLYIQVFELCQVFGSPEITLFVCGHRLPLQNISLNFVGM